MRVEAKLSRVLEDEPAGRATTDEIASGRTPRSNRRWWRTAGAVLLAVAAATS